MKIIPLHHPGTISTPIGDGVISLGTTSSAGTGGLMFSFSDEEDSESKSLLDSAHGVEIVAPLRGTNHLLVSTLT
jgi:hypothetical protein